MRVLIIGDAYCIHVCNFIQYTLSEMNIDEIVVFHILGSKENEKEYINQYYEKHNIKVMPQQGFSHSFENIVYHFLELKKMGRFDVCHLFSLNYSITSMGILMRPYCDILIANYLGSDWLRAATAMKEHQRKLLGAADYAVADSLQICEELKEYFCGAFQDKIKYIRYKLPVIEELKQWEQIEDVRKRMAEQFGVSRNQLVVTCGYSGWKSHKQLMVIDTIKKIPPEIRKKIFVLVPAGYGRDEQNIVDIKKALTDLGTGYYVAEEFMDFRGVAALRSLTDIFINMQPTDAYSSTVIEYCFCKKAIFCNALLDYSRLEEQGAFYEKVSDFEQLKDTLVRYIENYDEEIEKYGNNRTAAERFQGDSANNRMWEELYHVKNSETVELSETEADILQMLAAHYSKSDQTVRLISSLLERMAMMENIGHNIENWIKANHYCKIGIYGIGHLGRVVYFKLERQDGIKISAYDRNTRAVDWFENPVLEPDAMGSQGEDVIIITPVMAMDSIKQNYQDKVTARLLTIAEWIDEIA